MSKETIKRNLINEPEGPGFRSMLYINVPDYDLLENKKKDMTDSLENIRLGSNDFNQTLNMTPNHNEVYNYYISSDLMKRLEENSPIKSQKSTEMMFSNICLQACENSNENTVENLPSTNFKLNFTQNDEEIKQMPDTQNQPFESNSETIFSNVSNMRTRNYKLKTQLIPNKLNLNEGENDKGSTQKDESASLFGNANFLQNNLFSSPKYNSKQTRVRRKDSSPISSYYNGTTEYLSQTFLDEFKKSHNENSSKSNFIIKVEPLQEEDLDLNKNNNKLLDSNILKNNTFSYNPSLINADPSNKRNQIKKNFVNKFDLEKTNQFNQDNNYNPENYENCGNIENHETSNQTNSENNNLINPYQMNESPFNRYNPTYYNTYQYQSDMNNNFNMQSSGGYTEDYIVEMFGRRGWICEMCNNFNYETRQKCNRCGVLKTPKRIQKNKIENSDSKNSNSDVNSISIENSEQKKKKPLVQRTGDWVCAKCRNLNFSFRVVCNRCQLPKAENEKISDNYMNNLMQYVRYNESPQMQNYPQGGMYIFSNPNNSPFNINKQYNNEYSNSNLPKFNQDKFNSDISSYNFNPITSNVFDFSEGIDYRFFNNPYKISNAMQANNEYYDEEQLTG